MKKYRVITPWTGVKKGQILELESISPVFLANVVDVTDEDHSKNDVSKGLLETTQAEVKALLEKAEADAKAIIDKATKEAEDIKVKADEAAKLTAEKAEADAKAIIDKATKEAKK